MKKTVNSIITMLYNIHLLFKFAGVDSRVWVICSAASLWFKGVIGSVTVMFRVVKHRLFGVNLL